MNEYYDDSDEVSDHSEDNFNESDDYEDETPDMKRARLAQGYIDSFSNKKSKTDSDSSENEVDYHDSNSISDRLMKDRLKQQKKLHSHYSENIKKIDFNSLSIENYSGHKQSVTTVSLNTDENILVSGSKDNSAIRWDIESGKKTYLLNQWKSKSKSKSSHSNQNEILASAISSDGKYCAVGGRDKTIKIFDLASNVEIKSFVGHRDAITSLCFKHNSHSLFSSSLDRCIKHWDLKEMGYLETLFGHQEGIFSLDCFHQGHPLTGSGDGTIRFWDINNDSHSVYRSHKLGVDSVSFLTDDLVVSGGQDGSIQAWKTTNKKPLTCVVGAHGFESSIPQNKRWITSLAAFKMSDSFISGSYDGYLRFWGLKKLNDKFALENINSLPIEGFVNSISISNDFVCLATGQEHKLGRWWSIKGSHNKVVLFKLPIS